MLLRPLPYALTVCKLASTASLDLARPFYFIGRTEDEISLVCQTKDAPDEAIQREDGWRGFRVDGALVFSLVGILARISSVLAENGISIFAVSTYDTDYILVKGERFDEALRALTQAGYDIALPIYN